MTARFVLGALFAAAALPATAAAESWTTPATLDRAPAGGRLSSPAIAVGGDGATSAAWVESRSGAYALRASTIKGNTATPWLVQQSRRRIDAPAILTDGALSLFAWQYFDGNAFRIGTRSLNASRRKLGPLQFLTRSVPDASGPAFIGGTGGVRLAWLRGDAEPDLQLARPNSTGRFSATVRYDIEGAEDIDATVTTGNRVAAAFTRRLPGETAASVAVAVQGLDGLTEVASFANRDPASDPTIAADDEGRLVVAWTELVGGVAERVVVATREPGATTFSEPVELGTGTLVKDLALLPKSDGDTLVTWISSPAGVASGDDRGTLTVSTVTGGARAVNVPGQDVTSYAASTDGKGAAFLAWRTDAAGSGGPLYAARINAAELISSPRRRVTPSGERATSFSLGVSAKGVARLAWTTVGGRAVRMSRRVG